MSCLLKKKPLDDAQSLERESQARFFSSGSQISDRDKSRESNAQIALMRVKISRKARGCELKLNSTNKTETIRRFTIHKDNEEPKSHSRKDTDDPKDELSLG